MDKKHFAFFFIYCLFNFNHIFASGDLHNQPRLLPLKLLPKRNLVLDLSEGIRNMYNSFNKCDDFFSRTKKMPSDIGFHFAVLKDHLFLNRFSEFQELTFEDYQNNVSFSRYEIIGENIISKVYRIREIFKKLNEDEYPNCLPFFNAVSFLFLNLQDIYTTQESQFIKKLNDAQDDLSIFIQEYNALVDKIISGSPTFDPTNVDQNKLLVNKAYQKFTDMSAAVDSMKSSEKQQQKAIFFEHLVETQISFSKEFNLLYHVWNDDNTKKKLSQAKKDLISKLVIKLEIIPPAENGIQNAHLCSGFFINNNSKNYVETGNQVSFDSIFSAYHCFESCFKQNENGIVKIQIKTPSDVVLQTLKMEIKELIQRVGLKTTIGRSDDDFVWLKLNSPIEIDFEYPTSISIFPDNEVLKERFNSDSFDILAAGYPGIRLFKDEKLAHIYKFGERENQKSRKLALIELLNYQEIGRLLDQKQKTCRKNQGFVYCEKKTLAFSGGLLNGMSGGLTLAILEKKEKDGKIRELEIIYLGVNTSIAGAIGYINRHSDLKSVEKINI